MSDSSSFRLLSDMVDNRGLSITSEGTPTTVHTTSSNLVKDFELQDNSHESVDDDCSIFYPSLLETTDIPSDEEVQSECASQILSRNG